MKMLKSFLSMSAKLIRTFGLRNALSIPPFVKY